MLRVVLDTNVFISVLIGGRLKDELYPLLLRGKFQLVFSSVLFNELIYVLSQPKFNLEESDIENLRIFLKRRAIFVEPEGSISICRDVKDNKILECAIAEKVDFIVTGDKDLLILSPFHKIRIITPAEFLQVL